MQTCRYGIYHKRRKSKRPHASSCKPRDVISVQMWVGLSWDGPTKAAVNK